MNDGPTLNSSPKFSRPADPGHARRITAPPKLCATRRLEEGPVMNRNTPKLFRIPSTVVTPRSTPNLEASVLAFAEVESSIGHRQSTLTNVGLPNCPAGV